MRLEKVGWESDGPQIATVVVEVYEEPTAHTVNVKKLLDWLKQPGRFPRDENRKEKLRASFDNHSCKSTLTCFVFGGEFVQKTVTAKKAKESFFNFDIVDHN